MGLPFLKQVGKRYKDINFKKEREKLLRKDIWGEYLKKDHMIIAEIHGLVVQ